MPTINERDLKKHISEGNFKNFYLIYGDEKYLVRLYTDMLTEKLVGKNPPEFSIHTFNFMNLDLVRLHTAVLMTPFLSEKNCVKIEDVNPEKLSESDWKDFLALIEDLPETSVVIFALPSLEQDISKSARFKKLISLAEKQGICAELVKRSEFSLEKDLVRWAEKLGSKLSSANAGKLVEYTTNDIEALQNELRKLSAYANGGEITLEMIDKMVSKNLQTKVFALADSIIDGKADNAYSRLEILLYQKEKPTNILPVIAGVYIDAYRVKAAVSNGATVKNVEKDFEYKNRAFVLKRAAARASKFSVESLRECIAAITETDGLLKSSSVDKKIVLEKLTAKLLLIASNRGRTRV